MMASFHASQLGEGLSLPLSSLNHLRREVLEKLLQKREERPPISLDKEALEGLLQVSAHRAKTDTLPAAGPVFFPGSALESPFLRIVLHSLGDGP